MTQPAGPAPARPENVGRTCPYCRFSIKLDVEVVACPSCHAVHHGECWQDNGGCAVVGCAAAPDATAPPTAGKLDAPPRGTPPPPPPSAPAIPAAGQPASPRMRPIVLIVAGAVAAAAAAAVVVALAGGSADPDTRSTQTVSDVPAAQDPAGGGGASSDEDETDRGGDPQTQGVVATVARTCGADGSSDCFVSLRAGVTGRSAERRRLDEGATVRVVCQRHGEDAYSSVLGRSSDVWARTQGGLYLANVYLTGSGLDPDRITLPRCP